MLTKTLLYKLVDLSLISREVLFEYYSSVLNPPPFKFISDKVHHILKTL